MEMKKTAVSYLDPVLMDSRVLEQTQEVRIPDGMPDVDRILGVWGQPILRGKEWRGDTVGFNGGLMLWVLYQPEGGGVPETVESWVSVQSRWDIPENSPDGKLTLCMAVRFLDARTVSPRKIMVRAGLTAWIQALVPSEKMVWMPTELPEDVYILRASTPLRLYAQAGEKAFALEEKLTAPGEDLSGWKLCGLGVSPVIQDQKVVGSNLAFRGAVELNVLLQTQDGSLEKRSFSFPFSQIAELEAAFGNEGTADIHICVTNLELEDQERGKGLKLGLTAQYAVSDVTTVETAADAYSNLRPVKLTREKLELEPILERRWESIPGRGVLPEEVINCVHSTLWTEMPMLETQADGAALSVQGTAQILTKGEPGMEGKTIRWTGQKPVKAGEGTRTVLSDYQPGLLQLEPGAQMALAGEVRCCLTVFGSGGVPMVSELELGEPAEPDPDRPSLILCRPGQRDLWSLAKEMGSTMEAIRSANALEGEPEPDRMLLIPIM